MVFLLQRDLDVLIDPENLQEIVSYEQTIIDDCEMRAITVCKEFLSNRYDMNYEFSLNSTSGANFTLITIVGDIFKYNICTRVSPRQLNQIVLDRYNESKEKLLMINNGRLTVALRELVQPDPNDQTDQPFRWGNTISDNTSQW